MKTTDPSEKLPLPGPWQRAARAAMADLADRRDVPASAVAVTQAVPAPGGESEWLELWLLSGARTFRYRAALDGSAVEALTETG